MASFIKKSIFESQAKRRGEKDKVLNWSELSENVIYRITEVEVVEDGPFGTSYILYMSDRDNNKVKAWGSRQLIRDLKCKEEYDIPYIQSQGQKPFGIGKTINVYDLAFEKGEEIISLFISPSPSSSPSPPKKQKNE